SGDRADRPASVPATVAHGNRGGSGAGPGRFAPTGFEPFGATAGQYPVRRRASASGPGHGPGPTAGPVAGGRTHQSPRPASSGGGDAVVGTAIATGRGPVSVPARSEPGRAPV